MENNICCGFGHRFVHADISVLLQFELENLIVDFNVTVFLSGGMGDFDSMFSSAVRSLKRRYPDIRLFLVKPYFSVDLNQYGRVYEHLYDDVIIPDELADTHYKAAIGKRNRWMVDQSKYIVCYVYDDFGGAYQAVQYADKQGRHVLNLASAFHSNVPFDKGV